MLRPNGPEVALVEGEDPPGAELAREDGNREVGQAETEVGIAAIERLASA